MLDAVTRMIFGRDRVRWALPKVAAVLKQHFGASGLFTAGQVKRAMAEVGVAPDLHALIYATACAEAEFLKAEPTLSPADYAGLRAEIIALLDLSHSNLSMRLWMPKHRAESGGSSEESGGQ